MLHVCIDYCMYRPLIVIIIIILMGLDELLFKISLMAFNNTQYVATLYVSLIHLFPLVERRPMWQVTHVIDKQNSKFFYSGTEYKM